jgi:hypothetical protein
LTYGTTFVSFHGTVLNVPEKDQVDRILLNQDCEATKAAYPGDAGERLLTLQAEAGPVRKLERLKELVPVLKRFRRRGSIEAVGVIRGRIKLDLNHDQMQTQTFNHFFRTNILSIILMVLARPQESESIIRSSE